MEQYGEISKDRKGRFQLTESNEKNENRSDVVTGIVAKKSNRWLLQPLDPSEGASITVEPTTDLRSGDIATVKIRNRTSKHVLGSVQEIVHAENEASRAAFSLLRAYNVPFDGTVARTAASSLPQTIDERVSSQRKDLRTTSFVTIDGESARDFDDAVHGERVEGGGWRLRVAIADVAHYVRPGDPIDVEARSRGNSVYLPDRVVPMLPYELSSGICSLKPNEDRLAVVCDMRLSKQGLVEGHEFYEAVIRSQGRLTYTEAVQIAKHDLPGRSAQVNRSLHALYEVYGLLRQQRERRGALDFTERESTVQVSNGIPADVLVHARNDAHCLIEECMIAANVCAAKFLQEHQLSPLYRVHDGPDSKSFSVLKHDLNGCLSSTNALRGENPKHIQQLLEDIRSQAKVPWIWELQVLRSMTQAIYSFDNIGHFGLALDEYLHFTSPIRRYADLYVHRLIKAVLHGDPKLAKLKSSSRDLGSELSFCERRAVEVTRRVEAWLKCALLKKKIGKTFIGYVIRLEDFGVFVELDSYFISGLVHVSDLEDDYYEYDGTSLVGVSTGTTYKIGDLMKVRLVAVDVEHAKLDLTDATKSEIGHEFRKGKLQFKRQRNKRK